MYIVLRNGQVWDDLVIKAVACRTIKNFISWLTSC
jgi:hypothetical protein